VHHHLVPFARGARIQGVVERALGEQRQGVGLLLLHRGRVGVGRLLAPPLVEGLAGGVQRLEQQGADLGGQAPADPHRTVFVGVHVQRAAGVVPGRLPGLGLVHPPPAPHDALHVRGGPGAAHRQQSLLGLRGRDASQLPDLRVREFPDGQRLRQPRQRAERPGHPDVLAGRARGEPHPPGEPVGARAEPVVPAGAGVELADEIEQAGRGGVQVRGELGDLVAEPIEVRGAGVGRVDGHGWSPSAWATLHPRFGTSGKAPRRVPGLAIRVFRERAREAAA
jgi:hypothetical protein